MQKVVFSAVSSLIYVPKKLKSNIIVFFVFQLENKNQFDFRKFISLRYIENFFVSPGVSGLIN